MRSIMFGCLVGTISLAGFSSACSSDGDDDSNTPDCHDVSPSQGTGHEEICDGLDQDCDLEVDEGLPLSSYYQDRDGDGYGAGEAVELCGPTQGFVQLEGDCNDDDEDIHPGVIETCDGRDSDCNPYTPDALTFYPDADGDGFGAPLEPTVTGCEPPTGYAPGNTDCIDLDATIYPGASDITGDGLDSDCGGSDGAEPSVGLSSSVYTTIKDALIAASDGDTVWVGPGVYQEFEIDPYGARAVLAGAWGAPSTVLDGGSMGPVLRFVNGENSSSGVRGVTIRGGRADRGGGVLIDHSSPAFTDVVFADNVATARGGAIAMESSSSTFLRCIFTGNRVEADTGYGGAVAIDGGSPRFVDSLFGRNQARSGSGGGLQAIESTFRLEGTVFEENTASVGGSLEAELSEPTIHECVFRDNEAEQGGGLALLFSEGRIELSLMSGNIAKEGGGVYLKASSTSLNTIILQKNTASAGGGLWGGFGPFVLSHSLVTLNEADTLGGSAGVLITGAGTAPVLQNCIFAYNFGFDLFQDPAAPATPLLEQNDFFNPWAPGSHNLAGLPPGNLMLEPHLLDYAEDGSPLDFHLALDSPLLDAGSSGEVDKDGSQSDIGIYGGALGAEWDLDGDGFPAYFWPGTFEDVPPEVDASAYDRDDGEPQSH